MFLSYISPIAISVAILLLSSCNDKEADCQQYLYGCYKTNPVSIDPQQIRGSTAFSMHKLLFCGLCKYGKRPSEVLPAVADHWSVDDEGLTYTFFLKKSFWSDGSGVTAHDFIRAWRKILNPAFPCFARHLFYPIKNVRAILKGADKEFGVFAKDDYTLVVQLERKMPQFLQLLCFPVFCPQASKAVTNGPFTLAEYVPHSHMIFAPNSYFEGYDKSTKPIKMFISGSQDSAIHRFDNGEIDIVGDTFFPLDELVCERYKDSSYLDYSATSFTTFAFINTEKFPLKFRQFLTTSIDRNALSNHYFVKNRPARRLLMPCLQVTQGVSCLYEKYDKNEFIRYLASLGKTPQDVEFELMYMAEHESLALILQHMWQTNLGVKVHLVSLDRKMFFHRCCRKDFDTVLYYFLNYINDPIDILARFADANGGKNYVRWSNDRFASLVAQSATIDDKKKRFCILEKAEQILLDELPVIPLLFVHYPRLSHIPHLFESMNTGISLYETAKNKCSK